MANRGVIYSLIKWLQIVFLIVVLIVLILMTIGVAYVASNAGKSDVNLSEDERRQLIIMSSVYLGICYLALFLGLCGS